MSYQYIIDLNHNDELPVVIRKCNENFRAILSQRSKIAQIDNSIINNNIAEVVDDFEGLLAEEAEARENKDEDLQDQIDDIIASTGQGDYDSLINKPTITEVDLGVRQNGTFGPMGTISTVTFQGDDDYDGRLMKALTNADINAIIAAVETST